jgi:hypothetical protein
MPTPHDDVYKQLISIHQTIYDQHREQMRQIDEVKTCLHSETSKINEKIEDRIGPLEDRIAKQEQTITVLGKIITWVGVPSGASLIGFFIWVNNFFTNHQK